MIFGVFLLFIDNNLINGKNNFDCFFLFLEDIIFCMNNVGFFKFKFKKGKIYCFRFINFGVDGL